MKHFVYILILIAGLCRAGAVAQNTNLNGQLSDTSGAGLGFATVALLNPADSTMAFFGITNVEGLFEIKTVKAGNYLLQASYMGYRTVYKKLELPLKDGSSSLGTIFMRPKRYNLGEVQVTGERIPIMIKKDTIEYNAAAFKTKPDANVEDLLKKLPGVQVDKSGNVKAQGQDVKKVLVDGKEFFGSDPKVATKNLPADAVDKVQVYDKQSDQAEFTGIDDGTRNKTVNLQLKEDKKNGYFGDVQAGYGTNDRYQGSGKLYNFKEKTQIAALGMLNNINQFGFTLQDYINFKGGFRNMMSGNGSMEMRFDSRNSSFPINFGQTETGLITSGAGGANFTYEPTRRNRFNLSYLANGADKAQTDRIQQTNFTSELPFISRQFNNENASDRAHRANLSWRKDLDSTQMLTFSGEAAMNTGSVRQRNFSSAYKSDSLVNSQDYNSSARTNGFIINAKGNYLKTIIGKSLILRAGATLNYQQSIEKNNWQSINQFAASGITSQFNRYMNDRSQQNDWTAFVGAKQKLGTIGMGDLGVEVGSTVEQLTRRLGSLPESDANKIDSLSPYFVRNYDYAKPSLSFSRNTKKVNLNATAAFTILELSNRLNAIASEKTRYNYFTPSLSYKYNFSTTKNVGVNYNTSLNAPSVAQLLPIANTSNPLQIIKGNAELKPEYTHTLGLNALIYDQFSFTSFFVNMNAAYTQDKINWARTINQDLSQQYSYVNVKDNYNLRANVEFSSPIRSLGLTLDVNVGESYNQGLNFINGQENVNRTLTHTAGLTIGNRRKDKIDVNAGVSGNFSNAKYSLQSSMNNRYYNLVYTAEANYTPSDKWSFNLTADVSNYTSQTFGQSVQIPLLQAEISRYFLKANRGVLTLKAFDILNKNTGLQRSSDINYLLERQSNIIGRYFMLSFKYRLNKLGSGGDGGGIQIKTRR